MTTVFLKPRALLIWGLFLSVPAVAGQTGTNLVVHTTGQTGTNSVVRPAGQTGTNSVVRPAGQTGTNSVVRLAGQTGTNRSAVAGSAMGRSSASSNGAGRLVVRDARCASDLSTFDPACEQL